MIPWHWWRLRVLREQRERSSARPTVLPRRLDDLAGPRDLLPQLVQLAEQLHGVLLQRVPVERPLLAALRPLVEPNPPPVLHLLQIAPHGARLPEKTRFLLPHHLADREVTLCSSDQLAAARLRHRGVAAPPARHLGFRGAARGFRHGREEEEEEGNGTRSGSVRVVTETTREPTERALYIPTSPRGTCL